MRLRHNEYTIAVANTYEIFTLSIPPLPILGLTLSLVDEPTGKNVAYGQIGLLCDGITIYHKIHTFAQGNLDWSQDVHWSGYMPVPAQSRPFALVISDTTRKFKLNCLLTDSSSPTSPITALP